MTDLISGSLANTMSKTVALPRSLVNQLLKQAQTSAQREVCGLVSAVDGVPVQIYPVENISSTPARLFEMDPVAQMSVMRDMREKKETLFAIYHSHPAAPAFPSKLDAEQFDYDGVLYLIVSLGTKGVLEMRCFDYKNNARFNAFKNSICN